MCPRARFTGALLYALTLVLSFLAFTATRTQNVAATDGERRQQRQWQPQTFAPAAATKMRRPEVSAELRAAIEEACYHLERNETAAGEVGYLAPNPAQGWRVRFDSDGLSVETRAGGGEVSRWAMRLRSYGYGEKVVPVKRAEVSAAGNRVEYRRGSLVEWYVNERRGMEQGFTIREPPAVTGERAQGESLSLRLAVEGDLRAELSADGQSVGFLDAAGERELLYDQLVAFDARGRKLPTRMRVKGKEVRLEVEDAGAAYPLTIDPFVQQAMLQASDAAAFDYFGSAIAVSGDTAVVGAKGDDTSAGDYPGSAYVFTRSGTTWTQQQKLEALDAAANDNFGYSVAVDGDTIVVGSAGDDNSGGLNAGSAYVFVRNGTTWTQQQRLQAEDAGVGDEFGWIVALDGDTAIVGAYIDDNSGGANAGSAYVFTRSGTTWTQQQRLQAANANADDNFGVSVAVRGDTAIVGASGDDNSGGTDAGSAYIFTRSGTMWSEQQRLQAVDAAAGDNFGYATAIDGDTTVVGAYLDNNTDGGSDAGSAYVFTRSGAMWSQQARLQAADTAAGDLLGFSVAVRGDTAVVSAMGDDNSGGANAGSAYIFTRSGTTWTQQQRLQAADAAADDLFGFAVGIDGDTVVVAAIEDDNSGGMDAGSAYVFNSPPASVGQLIISEFRLQGVTPDDEFIELYNNTDAPIDILNYQLTINETLPRSTSIALGPPGPSFIPARGHYLVSHQTGYTLSSYTAGDITYSFGFNFTPDAGITLHNTANVLLDKVGFSTSPAGSCEGTCLTPTSATSQYSFVRRMETGTPKDSNNNVADFILVATDPALFGGAARLGAPGPENAMSPLPKLLPLLPGLLIDPTVGSASSPNRTRDTTPYTDVLTPSGPDGNTATPYTLGTLSVQRRVLNNTGQPVTRLRFRIIDVTTLSTPYYISSGTQADVRVLSSNGTTRAPLVLPPGVSLKGVKLEQSGEQMNQLKGGGWNSSLAAGIITMATPLAANDDPSTPNVMENAIDVQFLLGVASSGNFRFYVIVEALP